MTVGYLMDYLSTEDKDALVEVQVYSMGATLKESLLEESIWVDRGGSVVIDAVYN